MIYFIWMESLSGCWENILRTPIPMARDVPCLLPLPADWRRALEPKKVQGMQKSILLEPLQME